MTEENSAAGQQQQPQQQTLALQKVYLKDVSLEAPNSPQMFTESWKPEVNIQIGASNNSLSGGAHEVVLSLTITAKQNDKTAYLIELQQAGVFVLQGFNEAQQGPMLGAFCPNTLFPYAREAVDSLLMKSGFPPLHLNPINFDAIYQQQIKARQEQQQAAQQEQQNATQH
jgi:preprotein translocase subunit SecB